MILFFDGDGVVLKKFPYFTSMYSKKHTVPIERFNEFFSGPFKLCQKGQGDLKEGITPYLKSWEWQKSADAFLEYWFTTDVVPQEEMLAIIKGLKDRGHSTYLVSEQEKYRAEWIKNTLDVKKYFTGTFFTCDLRHNKNEKEFYKTAIDQLGVKPENIYYWDNDQKNITVAKNLGIQASLFIDIEQFEKEVAILQESPLLSQILGNSISR